MGATPIPQIFKLTNGNSVVELAIEPNHTFLENTMGYLLIKFNCYGGDADITYEGFFVLDTELWEIFKKMADVEYPVQVRMDCDGMLPASFRSLDSFLSIFKAKTITHDEYITLRKLFREQYDSDNSIIALSNAEVWSWVFERDDIHTFLVDYQGDIKV